jgi:hypothetical protein
MPTAALRVAAPFGAETNRIEIILLRVENQLICPAILSIGSLLVSAL